MHIIKHSKAVAKLGVFLARRIAEQDFPVNVDLVERACLLHDIFRVCEFPLELPAGSAESHGGGQGQVADAQGEARRRAS